MQAGMLETSSLLGAIVFATVLTVEVALRLPLGTVMRRTIAAARKAAHVVSSKRISDHWKRLSEPMPVSCSPARLRCSP